jgi:6-phosphogluconolactonase (cycloisomerase 2 family)
MSARFFVTVFVLLATLGIVNDLSAQNRVFTMTNSRTGNEIMMFNRSANGTFVPGGRFATQGLGSGRALGNQGAIVLSQTGRRLIAVNSGSNNVSLFRVNEDGLDLSQTIGSGGRQPVSIAMRGNLIFVLNSGGASGDRDNIVGFRLNEQGMLERIPGSTQGLSGTSTDPTQIALSRDGMFLIATERGTSRLTIFSINFDGTLNAGTSQQFSGIAPSGLAVGNGGRVFVSEAANNGANLSTLSSFTVSSIGNLQPVTSSLPTTQTGANSIVLSDNGQLGFVSNSNSGTISGFRVGTDGSVSLLQPNGISANTGVGSLPTNLALAPNSDLLFTLNSGTNQINTFRISNNGTLSQEGQAVTGLPGGVSGLAAQ